MSSPLMNSMPKRVTSSPKVSRLQPPLLLSPSLKRLVVEVEVIIVIIIVITVIIVIIVVVVVVVVVEVIEEEVLSGAEVEGVDAAMAVVRPI